MKGFFGNINDLTLNNTHFRHVLYTTKELQLVLMSLPPGEDIGGEVHDSHTQFIRCESGYGECSVDENVYTLEDDTVVIIPAGSMHNIRNTSSSEDLKLYTLYGPAHHEDQLIHMTKKEAGENDRDFDGKVTEEA